MHWLTQSLGSSIGKKLMMAITGLCFIGFLAAHLAGNLTIYGGKDSFNAYAEHLHALGILLNVAEFGLLFLAIVHVMTGIVLFYENLTSRSTRYVVNQRAGGRTLGSATMPYTGVLILLFVIGHLLNFSFVDKTHTTIYEIVVAYFSNPIYVFLYVFAVLVVAVHVSHGFWSLFQTIGLNHPKYMPLIKGAGTVISLVFGIGFGFLPLYIALLV